MFYVISFDVNDFLHYSYNQKSNIIVMTHCLFQAKRWRSKLGVYRAAKHLPKAFQDFIVIYQVDFTCVCFPQPQILCRWNLSAFRTYEIQEDLRCVKSTKRNSNISN